MKQLFTLLGLCFLILSGNQIQAQTGDLFHLDLSQHTPSCNDGQTGADWVVSTNCSLETNIFNLPNVVDTVVIKFNFSQHGNTSSADTITVYYRETTADSWIIGNVESGVGNNSTKTFQFGNIVNYSTMQLKIHIVAESKKSAEFRIYDGSINVWSWQGFINDPSVNPSDTTEMLTHTEDNTDGSTLPIELLNFDYQIKNNLLLFNWQTASEQNQNHFDIMYADESQEFKSVAHVNGYGNSNELQSYFTFIPISEINNGIAYFYLLSTDNDGKTQKSNLLSFINQKAIDVRLIPSTNNIQLQFMSSKANTAKLQIIDALGRIVKYEEINITDGFNSIDLNIQKNNKVLFIQLYGEGINYQRKLVH